MNHRRMQSLMTPDVTRQARGPVQGGVLGASAALLSGFLFLSALQMAVPGAATAAPVGQPQGSAPHYFSVANWANSQLPVTATFTSAAGVGAVVVPTAITNGSVAALTIKSGGFGYAAGDTATIGPATTLGTATVTAVDPATGAITAITLNDGGSGYSATNGIRKFVDSLDLSIPVAVPDTSTYPGSDYYEIAVVEYSQKMHTDLLPTKLRGYQQLNRPGGVLAPHYLGPIISATKDRPVRILFRNLLPLTANGGDLFLPVDTSIIGSGRTNVELADADPQNPFCGGSGLPPYAKPAGCYTENRAELHLHGGLSPWISDGTPHQWITPAGEKHFVSLKGVSVKNVPDMPDPGPGAATFFYTNQQSARLMFYHDHAWGITRLNVYAGEAAPYVITDANGTDLVDSARAILHAGRHDSAGHPGQNLCAQSEAQLAATDPTVGYGPLGRIRATSGCRMSTCRPRTRATLRVSTSSADGPTAPGSGRPLPLWIRANSNPYYDPNCNPDIQWCEPPLMPGTPYVSYGHGGLPRYTGRQRHRLPDGHGGAQGLPVPHSQGGQRPFLQPVVVQGCGCDRRPCNTAIRYLKPRGWPAPKWP